MYSMFKMTRLSSVVGCCFLIAVTLHMSATLAATPPWTFEQDAGCLGAAQLGVAHAEQLKLVAGR
jgi:hypothetical protein